jgi:hypothetical protein
MYRMSALVLGLSILTVGCSDSPSGPSSPSAPSSGTSTTTTFTVPLAPSNEVPAITNADASGSGSAIIVLTAIKDAAGAVTSATVNIQISVEGFQPGTTFTDAHIHNGAAGSNAGVFVSAGLSAGELTLTNGKGSISKNGISVPAERAAAILANPAGHYFNVHTGLNPAGAIRGQLQGGGALVEPGVTQPY